MKTYFRRSIPVLSVVCSLIISSCNLLQNDPPPYAVSKPVCLIEGKPGYFNFAGIEFDFFNAGEKNISGIYISFMVYDADSRENPFYGSNIINVSFDGVVKPQVLQKFFISLDDYIYTIPDKAYLIDFFYVARIAYEDGSRWEDPSGVYYTSSY